MNMVKNRTRTKPSIRLSWLGPLWSIKTSLAKKNTANTPKREYGISFLIVACFTTSGAISAATPKIRRELDIFEPIILPRAMPVLPLMLAITLTTSSGAEVPKATTVKPIKKAETPNRLAIDDEPSTMISAPLMRNTKPIINRKISIYIFLF